MRKMGPAVNGTYAEASAHKHEPGRLHRRPGITPMQDKPDVTSRDFRVYSQRHGRKKFGLSPRQSKRISKRMLRAEKAGVIPKQPGVH